MDQIDRIVQKRAAIKETCEKYGATAVRIFGSCARNDYDEKSDIEDPEQQDWRTIKDALACVLWLRPDGRI